MPAKSQVSSVHSASNNGANRKPSSKVIGSCPALLEALVRARKAARSGADILIEADSGTGKELLARLIHDESSRAAMPFISINCAAVPESLLEAELFGHARGAFASAGNQVAGKLKQANGGTLLINEIGELPLTLQLKLLRVLQERAFYPPGDSRLAAVDVRIIASTHRSLGELVSKGSFREDLYHRLNVIRLTLPPLRYRGHDVIELAQYFVAVFAPPNALPTLSKSFQGALLSHNWPGNVRELANTMRRAVALCEGEEIKADLLLVDSGALTSPLPALLRPGLSLREVEKSLLEITLHATSGNRTHAAELLGVSLRTIRNKIREYGLPPRSLA